MQIEKQYKNFQIIIVIGIGSNLGEMKSIYCLLLLVLFSCKENPKEYIILTVGSSENPDTPRIGIECQVDKVYFCKEKLDEKTEYDYYFVKFATSNFLNLKNAIETNFIAVNQQSDVVDASLYELIYSFETGTDTLRFHRAFLTKEQNFVVDNIIKLQNQNFTKINYHQFPETLLKLRLPSPPPLKILPSQ